MSVFENLVGQEHVVEIIKAAVAATRSGAVARIRYQEYRVPKKETRDL